MAGDLNPWSQITRLLKRRGVFLVPVLVILLLTVLLMAMIAARNVRHMFEYSPF